MTKIERVERSLAGIEVDRPPVSFWYHFGVQHELGDRIAELSLNFFHYYDLDYLKLMNDYYYPMPDGVQEIASPEDLARIAPFDVSRSDWAEQLRAIEIISRELDGKAYFIDTVFEPWQVLMRSLAGEHLQRLIEDAPDAVLNALDVITENIIAYCKEALARGCSGIFLSTFGSRKQMKRDAYLTFALPFVRRIFEAIEDKAIMNTAHVHDYGIYTDDVVDLPVHILSYEDRDT